ncbi:MAG TPA: hypothetical protein VGP17_07400 [Solirubrobacteraceae bacterium]|nr:hypothetical protein [Solirubrobacteraceae bacterium]
MRPSRLIYAMLMALLAAALLSACGGGSKPSHSSTTSSTSSSTTASTSAATSTSAGVTGTNTAPGIVSASAAGVTATLHATTHSPKVNVPWPISFTVAKSGSPVQAKLVYEYLFGGTVVAKRSNYTFTGHFHDNFLWPGSAVGYPLTFRAVITAGGQTLLLDYPVQVVR